MGTSSSAVTNETSATDAFELTPITPENRQGYANTENNTPIGDDSMTDPFTQNATAKNCGTVKSKQLAKNGSDTKSDSQSQNEQSSPYTAIDLENSNVGIPKSTSDADSEAQGTQNSRTTSLLTVIFPFDLHSIINVCYSAWTVVSTAVGNLLFSQHSPPAEESLLEEPKDTSEINQIETENNQSVHREHETHNSNKRGKKRKAEAPFQQAIDNDHLKDYKEFIYTIDQGKFWLDLQFHNQQQKSDIKKPHEIEIPDPPKWEVDFDADVLDRIKGSMIGMALGDALGAHVEFRPRDYLVNYPVDDLQGGGTWGLNKGQFTDDTSMALCLANSLIACRGFVPYDQLVRYKWWYMHGYMSSTGDCFDIGSATKQSIEEFRSRQNQLANKLQIPADDVDYLCDREKLNDFNEYCSSDGVAGNGALMRLAPVPLFFFKSPKNAVEYSGISGQITHGDQKSYDACRYYGALIVAALHGLKKDQLLDDEFYLKYKSLFGGNELHEDIKTIAEGSYKRKNGYDGGIRGKGYIVDALEAALWAFYSTKSFEDGVLAAVNLGDDTDTTAAIYGQLAGAFYGYKRLPEKWTVDVYAGEFLEKLCEWITYEGDLWCKSPAASTE